MITTFDKLMEMRYQALDRVLAMVDFDYLWAEHSRAQEAAKIGLKGIDLKKYETYLKFYIFELAAARIKTGEDRREAFQHVAWAEESIYTEDEVADALHFIMGHVKEKYRELVGHD